MFSSSKRRTSILPFILLLLTTLSHAQILPVQVTPQLVPPYSVYLSDYATAGNEKLRVIVLQRDLSRPAYQVRLMMTVEWNNKIIMRTARNFRPAPLHLVPGVPTIITGAELAPYLDSRNIDFVGYDRAQYEKTRALPEGQYRISFIAYDYSRQDVPVSPEGSAFYFLAKSEPPLVNYPPCASKITPRTPQQIIFSWFPRNTSSPNSALDTEYELSLYETRPPGRNPNDVVLSSPPVVTIRTNQTQFAYGPGEPLLLTDMTYVWRVRAIDINGKDAFRNNGYSEVCTFYYGGADMNFEVGVVKDLQAKGESKNRARIFWTPGFYDAYRVEYKKTGAGYEWFRTDTKNGEIKVFDLDPDTEYETRIQAKKSGYYGPYSEIVKFRTLPDRVAQCGEPPRLPDTKNPGPPLKDYVTGTVVDARGVEMTLLQVTPLETPGWFKGIGRVTLDYLLGLSYGVTFERIYINENREVVLGRIDVMTEGMARLVKEQLASKTNKIPETTADDPQWENTDFYDKIFQYDDIAIENISVNADGDIIITDASGQSITNTEIAAILVNAPEKAIIIEDKNGDQYVVQKDQSTGKTKITKVEGGGLSPGSIDTPSVQADPIKDRIIVLILEQFEKEIAAWLRINGKGGEDDPHVLRLEELPQCLPRNANILEHIDDHTIPYFKEHPAELQAKIESNPANKELLDRIASSLSNADAVAWEKIKQPEQEALQDAACPAIVEGDRDVFEAEFKSALGASSSKGNCFMQGWERGKQLYGAYDAGIAIYAGFIRYLTCTTEKENCGSSKLSDYTCGLTNGLLTELDWIVLLEGEGITKEDVARLILCVKDAYPIGGKPEDNPRLYEILFKCITGSDVKEVGNGLADFVVENWDEPYYQGQATAFVATLLSPYKAKILEKLKTLSVYASKITKLEALAQSKTFSEFNALIKKFAKGVGKTQLLAKLDNFPNLKTWVNSFDAVADANLITKVDGLDAADLGKLNTDIVHTKYGSEIKTLLKESPDDLTEIWKRLKDDPGYSWEIQKTGGSRWEKWSQREFFRDVTGKGKFFETETCLTAFRNRSSSKYLELKNKVSTDFGKNLDDYDMYSQVQLKYDGDNYFVADQLFVKYKTVAGQRVVDDVIVIENKLSSSTPLTTPQSNAFQRTNFTVRSQSARSQFGSGVDLTNGKPISFSGSKQWYKVYDGENGDVISGIQKMQ